MKTKKLLAMLLAGILALSATACSKSEGKTDTKEETSKADTATDEGKSDGALSGKLSIWSWGADAEKVAREKAVEIFTKEHPELKIEHVVLPTADSVWDQKSAAAFSAGNAGDIMQMSPDYYGLMTDQYEDLRPYVEKDGVVLEDMTVKGAMDGYYRPDGKLEAMPLLANCFVYAYNKELFDKVGVPYPTDDWTWDDFAAMAPKFVSGEGADHTYFMVNHWATPNFAILSKGGKPYTDDLTKSLMDSKEVAQGLDMFGKMYKDQAVPDDVAAKNLPKEQLFVSGKAAVFPMGGFEIASVSKTIGDSFKWGAVLPPKTSTDGTNVNVTYATGYAMNQASKNKDAAWQFLKETTYANDDMAKETAKSGMPANKKIAESDFAAQTYGEVKCSTYVEALATSKLNLWGGALATAGDQWTQMWQSATIDGKSAAEAQAEYAPLIEKAFTELNLKK